MIVILLVLTMITEEYPREASPLTLARRGRPIIDRSLPVVEVSSLFVFREEGVNSVGRVGADYSLQPLQLPVRIHPLSSHSLSRYISNLRTPPLLPSVFVQLSIPSFPSLVDR